MNLKRKRKKLRKILFDTDSKLGRLFDIILLCLILGSVLTVILESVNSYSIMYRKLFMSLEMLFTIIFSLEYLLRLVSAEKPKKYALSYLGIIDLISIVPAYLSIFVSGTSSLLIIRSLRILRIFRIFKLTKYLKQGNQIIEALNKSRPKITVFLIFVILIATIIGSLMYVIEAKSNPAFDNIPRSIYWAIVTLTTVGYGDIAPNSPLGQAMASLVMILGYSILAVPTGIITNELGLQSRRKRHKRSCHACPCSENDLDALYCKKCGIGL